MTNEEMYNLIEEFKAFIRHTGKVSPIAHPLIETMFNTFYTWFADRKLK